MKRLTLAMIICVALLVAAPALAGETAKLAEEVQQVSGIQAGVCVQLECGDGQVMADLARGGRFLVDGLSSDATVAATARRRLAGEGLAGFAGVQAFPLKSLPYADNLVNLLFAEDLPGLLKKGLPLAEILRVLCPNGVACLAVPAEQRKEIEAQAAQAGMKDFRFEQKSRLWLVFRKPRPAGMDDWTHWNHGPDGNLVSGDQLIERPNQLQWIAGPHWRSLRAVGLPGDGGVSGMRSANGRNYYIQEGRLVVRDAFNGVMLWHRVIDGLDSNQMIASGNEVYLTRGKFGELVALDGATGKDVRSYGKAVDFFSNLLLVDGVLLSFESRGLRAIEAATGKVKWVSKVSKYGDAPPVAAGGKVFFTQKHDLVCLELAGGKELFRKDVSGLGDLLFAFNDMLLFRPGRRWYKTKQVIKCTALSGKDGAEAWSYAFEATQPDAPAETHFASGLVWIHSYDDLAKRDNTGLFVGGNAQSHRLNGLDPKTGEVRRSFLAPLMHLVPIGCHRHFATDRFFIADRPLYFTDWKTGNVTRFEGTRLSCGSACGLGQGMFFGTDMNAACHCMRPAMTGISGYTSDGKTINGEVKTEEAGRLEKGPAAAPEAPAAPPGEAWPMYRHDPQRSAGAAGDIPAELAVAWTRKLLPVRKDAPQEGPPAGDGGILRNDWLLNKVTGDEVTQPAAAEGKVFVSLTHARQVVALDEKTGAVAWTFYAPARLDAPPSIYKGVCLFGCNDGWVYCLRSDDGQLVWRFRAAPAERRMVAYGQVESAWPVVGGVLLVGDAAFVVAGRTTEADGGLYVHALEPKTGRAIWSERYTKTDDGPVGTMNESWGKMYVGSADLLVSDGKTVAVGGRGLGYFDCKTGGKILRPMFPGPRFGWWQKGYGSLYQGGEFPPLAQFGSLVIRWKKAKAEAGKAAEHNWINADLQGKHAWKIDLPNASARVESLATVGDASGKDAPGGVVLAAISRTSPNAGGELLILSAKDGAKLASYELPGPPAWDGLAVAKGNIYVSLQDGSITCLREK